MGCAGVGVFQFVQTGTASGAVAHARAFLAAGITEYIVDRDISTEDREPKTIEIELGFKGNHWPFPQ